MAKNANKPRANKPSTTAPITPPIIQAFFDFFFSSSRASFSHGLIVSISIIGVGGVSGEGTGGGVGEDGYGGVPVGIGG